MNEVKTLQMRFYESVERWLSYLCEVGVGKGLTYEVEMLSPVFSFQAHFHLQFPLQAFPTHLELMGRVTASHCSSRASTNIFDFLLTNILDSLKYVGHMFELSFCLTAFFCSWVKSTGHFVNILQNYENYANFGGLGNIKRFWTNVLLFFCRKSTYLHLWSCSFCETLLCVESSFWKSVRCWIKINLVRPPPLVKVASATLKPAPIFRKGWHQFLEKRVGSHF